MLVSFTGAQSTGKSTLLNLCMDHLLKQANDWTFVPEVTRLIKRTHGVSINEQGDDDTQLLIMNQHLLNTINYKSDGISNHMMDRCVVDGYVYSKYLHNHGRLTGNTWRIVECMYEHLLPELHCIFYTHPEDIPIEDDGERSVNQDFRNEIIDIYDSLETSTMNNWVILKGDPHQRMDQILSHLQPELYLQT